MKGIKSKAGFTLLEILVVIIIVGVLASVAMPQLFRNVERSRVTEAMEAMGVTKRSIEACAMQFNNTFTTCNTYALIGMADPSYNAATNASAHFGYGIAVAANSFAITATRNTVDNGVSTDTVSLSRAATGAITRAGTTAFAGVQ